MNASRALKEASIVIMESPAALQLRYLQTLTTIAAEKNSTIILTKDSVTIMVDGVVYYRVWNAILSVANVLYTDPATRLLAQTTLRNILGTKDLAQILSDREEIAQSMQITLDKATDDWGIKVELVEIKDVKLPFQLQRAMAAEAEAAREARAKGDTLFQVVTEYEEPVIMRFGHARKNVGKGAGVYFILPCTDSLTKVDMRTKAIELPFQEIFTKDPLIIDVDGVIYYRVQDAFLAVTKISDVDAATNLLAKAIMKNTLGAQTLSHLISDREKIAKEIQ
ncbi:hypothetical protein Chor_002110, partial [Crotalus horridus]